MFRFYCFFLFLLTDVICGDVSGRGNISLSPNFVPSADWKVVKPGQAIPAGIHVRHDFETGITEGKLMDENPTEHHTENQLTLSHYNVTDTAYERNSLKSHKMNISFNSAKQFRSLKELRKDAEKINMFAETDSTIMQQLFVKYKSSTEESQKSFILEDISEYLHQFDNAVAFASDGRLGKLADDLASAPFDRKTLILRCLSSAMQGNPIVKLKMLESGFLDLVCQQLQLSLSSSDEHNPIFISVAISTLGIFLRHFPQAQSVFLYPQNIFSPFHCSNLLYLLAESPVWLCQSKDCERLKLRTFSFIGDLLIERNRTDDTENDKMNEDIRVEKIKTILCHPWREKFGRFLTENEFLLDHDPLERLIKAGIELTSRCSPSVASPHSKELRQLSDSLSRLERKYYLLAKLDEHVDELEYFRHIHGLLLLLGKSVSDNYTSELTVEHSEL